MSNNLTANFESALRAYVQSADFKKLEKDNPLIAEQYKRLKGSDLSVDMSASPKIVRGVIVGNATAVSASNAADVTRTVNVDFTSREYLFLMPGGFVPKSVVRELGSKSGNPYSELDVPDSKLTKSWAKEVGEQVCAQELDKFNFRIALGGYTLKSYRVEFTGEPEEVKIYPVYADLKDGKGNSYRTVVGFYRPEDVGVTVGNYLEGQAVYGKTSKKAKGKKRALIALGIVGGIFVAGGIIVYALITHGVF